MGMLLNRLRNGAIVRFPDTCFNTHDSIREYPGVSAWIRTIGLPLNDSNDKPERFVLMHENITEYKQAEKALHESEERYRQIIELAVDGILLGSTDRKIIGANSRMQKWLGRPLEQLLGIHVSELFDPEELKSNPLQFDRLNLTQLLVNERNLRRSDETWKCVPKGCRTALVNQSIATSPIVNRWKKKRPDLRKSTSNCRNSPAWSAWPGRCSYLQQPTRSSDRQSGDGH